MQYFLNINQLWCCHFRAHHGSLLLLEYIANFFAWPQKHPLIRFLPSTAVSSHSVLQASRTSCCSSSSLMPCQLPRTLLSSPVNWPMLHILRLYTSVTFPEPASQDSSAYFIFPSESLMDPTCFLFGSNLFFILLLFKSTYLFCCCYFLISLFLLVWKLLEGRNCVFSCFHQYWVHSKPSVNLCGIKWLYKWTNKWINVLG